MTDHESSEEIRREIEETRSHLSDTVDAIQDQLRPENIKAQAQTFIQDSLTGSADSVVEYVRTNREELVTSLTNSVRKNPLPALLVGAGLGWLLIDSLSSSSSSPVDYPIQRYGAYGDNRRPYDYGYDRARWARGAGDRFQQAPAGYGGTGYADERWTYEYEDDESGSGINRAVENVKEKVAGAADSVRDAAAQAGEAVQDAAAEARQRVQRTGESAQAAVDQWGTETSRQVGAYQRQASVQVDRYGRVIQEQAAQVGDQAQYYAQRAQYAARETINDNPLLFGAVAMGVGALVALVLPETRQENALMGSVSDEVMRSARGAVHDVAQRAQTVIEEVRPEVEQAVQEVAKEAQQVGQRSLEELKATGADAAKRVQEKTQATVESEASKAQSDLERRAEQGKSAIEKSVKPDGSSTQSSSGGTSTGSTSKSST